MSYLFQRLTAAALFAATTLIAHANGLPPVVRIGVASPSVGNPPRYTTGSIGLARHQGLIDAEFKGTGTRIEWFFFKGAGPAVNEALTNRQLDIVFQGDLPSLMAKAAGLNTRLVLPISIRSNVYLLVPPDSSIRGVADLKGRRVSLFRGTNAHLPINRILAAHGLKERDVRLINFDNAAAQAALTTRDIDAAFVGVESLKLVDKGIARIAYSTQGRSPVYTRQSALLATDDFARRHPDAVQRVVRGVVRAAHWASQEENRAEVFKTWALMGYPVSAFETDYARQPLKERLSPLFDPFLVGRYQDAVAGARAFRLARGNIDVERWIDRRFVDTALKDLKLTGYWQPLNAQGKPLTTQTAAR
ncbi:ABC transporter substrate-binding protein [Chitiniphilus purpureus]|uniref:ABC transporter substrate-binding protein n=1 Tax=Chitiniphilus purpureus TaxID=2981137 RepID=A0ABY6DNX1_9NEIS|nr:ABC transporter substrate-binding protein [Chitiniphilus sp. CD1]UXY16054.1 ABC transporter substrate-binding protein [Chitiniphilus sp. CD1]